MNMRNSTYPASGSEGRSIRVQRRTGNLIPHSNGSRISGLNRTRSSSVVMPRTILLLCLICLLAVPRPARAQDSWFGPDKILHFFGAFMVTSVSYVVAYNVTDWDHWEAVTFGVSMGVIASVGKEFYDSVSGRGEASGWDLVWDGIGIGMGVLFIDALADPPSRGPSTGQTGDGRVLSLRLLSLTPSRSLFRIPEFRPSKPVDTLYGVPTLGLPPGAILRPERTPEGD